MLKIGVVGLNQGNGHPYSFSAVFNGFDNDFLQKECEFALIKEYLPNHHGNREFISDARVTAVYAPEAGAAERAARIAKIPNVANSLEELADSVDAILFTRDDIDNHWSMAGSLFKTGKPIFMDKVLAHNEEDLRKFIAAAGKDYPLMTASSFAFSPEIDHAKEVLSQSKVMFINGVSSCVWVRYAPHLLGALFKLFGNDIAAVQNSGNAAGDIVTLHYRNGLAAVLEVFNGVGLPLGLTVHRQGEAPLSIDYTDRTLESYFLSIAEMMKSFRDMCLTGKSPTPWNETIKLNKIVLAGIASKEQGGKVIEMDSFLKNIGE